MFNLIVGKIYCLKLVESHVELLLAGEDLLPIVIIYVNEIVFHVFPFI